MSKQKRPRPSDEHYEHWTKLIRSTMEEPAWRALSKTAQALYPWLKFEWRGVEKNNNGKIRLSVRQAAARLGIRPATAASAFHDLQRKGFIVQTEQACLGIEGAAKSPAYEITELKMPRAELDGRKLYREWRAGHDFPVQMTGSNNPLGRNGRKTKPRVEKRDGPVSKTVTKTADPVTKTVTRCVENRDENALLSEQTVTESVTSLSYHTPLGASPPARGQSNGQAREAGDGAGDGLITIGVPTAALLRTMKQKGWASGPQKNSALVAQKKSRAPRRQTR